MLKLRRPSGGDIFISQRSAVFGATAMATVLAAALAGSATAQDDESTPERRAGADVIIVTAQKREQSIQDVPASIQAITADMLTDIGADDFIDYARTVPSLSFVNRGPGLNKVVIRGISSNAGVGTTAIYIDDIPITTDFLTPDLKLFDVDRVEVLRGPQGTLYGEGSMGGTIKIITAAPDPTGLASAFEGTYSSTEGGGSNYAANAMINLPLIADKLAVRAVGYYRDEDGWIDNVALGQNNVNDENTVGGRISAKLQATDNFTITGTVLFQDTETGGEQIARPALGDLKQTRLVEEHLDDEFLQGNVTFKYDLGWAELVSSTSYFDREQPFNRELPDVAQLLMTPTAEAVFSLDTEVRAQEFRLTSPDDQRLRWLIGLFYKDREDRQVNYATADGIGEVFRSDAVTKTEQIALFGDLSYDVTDKLEASVGVRWFDEDQSAESVSTIIFTGFVPEYLDEDASNTAVTPRFTLSYDVSDDAMLYGVVSRGFRSGGLNLNAFPGTPATFEPDAVWNYEAGVKSSWYDDRLIFNAGAYYIDWSDMQVVDSIVAGVTFTSNAGAAHSTGMEVELTALPTDRLTLTAAGGYNEAELDEDAPTEGGMKGDRVPYVPHYTARLAGDYRFPISGDLDGVVRVDYQFVGNSYNALSGNPAADIQHSYEIGNVRVGVENDAWSLYAFINNVSDERAEQRVIRDFLGNRDVYYAEPRTMGVTLRMSY